MGEWATMSSNIFWVLPTNEEEGELKEAYYLDGDLVVSQRGEKQNRHRLFLHQLAEVK